MDQDLKSTVEQARAALDSVGEVHGYSEGERPRFELFHAASSICSQKVRAVLSHHRLTYVGHALNMFVGQTYLPGYVRLRMVGCDAFGGELASRHSGSTSTAAGGCDGAVVPTLVDWDTDAVIVDSKRICLKLDELVPEMGKLRPARLAAAIDEDLQVIDNLPNYQMLMGRSTGGVDSAASTTGLGSTFSERKVAWCDSYLEERHDDRALVAAYTAKRAKELSAATELFSPEAMRSAYTRAERAVVDLERKLAKRTTRWLYGDQLTMADLFWGVELLRMKNTGVASYWEGDRLPHVEWFSAATEQIRAIRTAIIDWPGAMF